MAGIGFGCGDCVGCACECCAGDAESIGGKKDLMR